MAGAAFERADGHAKFGVESADGRKADARHAWTPREWAAVLAKIDRGFEAALGFAYSEDTPGAFFVHGPPPESTWLAWGGQRPAAAAAA